MDTQQARSPTVRSGGLDGAPRTPAPLTEQEDSEPLSASIFSEEGAKMKVQGTGQHLQHHHQELEPADLNLSPVYIKLKTKPLAVEETSMNNDSHIITILV